MKDNTHALVAQIKRQSTACVCWIILNNQIKREIEKHNTTSWNIPPSGNKLLKNNQDRELTLNVEDKYLLIMALIVGSITRVVASVVLVEVSDSESVVGTVEWGYQVLVTWF